MTERANQVSKTQLDLIEDASVGSPNKKGGVRYRATARNIGGNSWWRKAWRIKHMDTVRSAGKKALK